MEQKVIASEVAESALERYEAKFKALADKQRLRIIFELRQRGKACVCDLSEWLQMPQSKLSYHLKILLDAGIIGRDCMGTWSYYTLNDLALTRLLSEELCCVLCTEGAE